MGERIEFPESWQFPQGGIDADEDPWLAAQRELFEEVGIAADKIEYLGETSDWLTYNFPEGITGHPIYGHHAGQKQKWFAARFLGNDSDIKLDAHHAPEFARTRWADLREAPAGIVAFKREVYEALVREFKTYAA